MYELCSGGIPFLDSDPFTLRLQRVFYIFNIALLHQLFLLLFLRSFVSPLSYRLPIRSRSLSKTSCFSPALHLLSWCKASSAPPPSSLRCSSLCPTPRTCVCRRFLLRCDPPFCLPQPAPGSLSAPGGFSCRGSLCDSMSLPRPPQSVLQILASSGPWFLVRWIFARE